MCEVCVFSILIYNRGVAKMASRTSNRTNGGKSIGADTTLWPSVSGSDSHTLCHTLNIMSTFANEVKLRQVVSESYTYSDVIKTMGLKVGITTINRLKKYIQQYNISTTHFTRDNRRRIWDETRLRELISTAQCYADVLASLGVRTQGANIKTLKSTYRNTT